VKTLVVIPARKNSSRVAGKNMLSVAGKPCLQYGIERALASEHRPTVAVVSDDEAALELAEELGVIALHEPDQLAHDDNLYHVFRWVLGKLETCMDRFDLLVKGVANAPISPPDIIDRLIRRITKSGCKSAIPLAQVPLTCHPYSCHRQVCDGRIVPYLIGNVWINSQNFPPLYSMLGGETVFDRDVIDMLADDRQKITQVEARAVFVDRLDIVEVDTMEDVLWAEFLLGRQGAPAM
jgi:CMP-N-acetylneuraminic acid synthetase